jgi:hypothetical protein
LRAEDLSSLAREKYLPAHLPRNPLRPGHSARDVEEVRSEIIELKRRLQHHLEDLESNVEQLLSEREIHNIIG